MTRPVDETLLAFLEGTLDATARADLLDRLDADPALALELQQAAAGYDAIRLAGRSLVPDVIDAGRRRVSPWWLAAASVATLAIAVPATLRFSPAFMPAGVATESLGRPVGAEPTFVLVLHGRWPDAATVAAAESARRATEYWGWTSSLAEEGILVAAGDLRWEPGQKLASMGVEAPVDPASVDTPEFVVGMLALRTNSYDEAVAIARACPHLRYGGSVSVRRVGAGFVTVAGMGDWAR